MKSMVWLVFVVAILGVGCSTSGPRFGAAGLEGLEIGVSSSALCRERFGEPTLTESRAGANGTFEIWRYKTQAERGVKGCVRLMVLEFKDRVLNGYAFGSTFEEDRSAFAVTNLTKLVVEGTTREQARELLGKPAGKFRCPSEYPDARAMCVSEGQEVWMFFNLEAIPLLPRSRQKPPWLGTVSHVAFDEDGRVANVVTRNSTAAAQ